MHPGLFFKSEIFTFWGACLVYHLVDCVDLALEM